MKAFLATQDYIITQGQSVGTSYDGDNKVSVSLEIDIMRAS